MVDLLPPPTSRGVQLERPQEVGGVLEVGSNGQNLRRETVSEKIKKIQNHFENNINVIDADRKEQR